MVIKFNEDLLKYDCDLIFYIGTDITEFKSLGLQHTGFQQNKSFVIIDPLLKSSIRTSMRWLKLISDSIFPIVNALKLRKVGIYVSDSLQLEKIVWDSIALSIENVSVQLTSRAILKDKSDFDASDVEFHVNFKFDENSHKVYAESLNHLKRMMLMTSNQFHPGNATQMICETLPSNIAVKILEIKDFPTVYAVGKGSDKAPLVLELTYKGKPQEESFESIIVGKGVTMDTGGYCIKGGEHMYLMNRDKTGALMSTMIIRSAACLQLPINMKVLLGFVENAISHTAFKTGDVITARNGRTIEVINTDAEGRVVLYDLVDYAKSFSANKTITIATLTGAISIALGDFCAGFFTNEEKFALQLSKCQTLYGERVWRLPLDETYNSINKSSVAHIANLASPRGKGGSISGAKFIEDAAPEKGFIHFDIAGYIDAVKGQFTSCFLIKLLTEFAAESIVF